MEAPSIATESSHSPDFNQPMEESYHWLRVINNINSIYTIPIIVLVGMAANLPVLAVFGLSTLRRFSTSVYLAVLSLTNIIFLISLGMEWMDGNGLSTTNWSGKCQTMVFFTCMTSILATWISVAYTAKLYTSMHIPRLHAILKTPKRVAQLLILMTVMACLISAYTPFYSESVKIDDNHSVCIFKGSQSTLLTISIIDTLLGLIIPFSLVVYMTIRILFTLKNSSKDHSIDQNGMTTSSLYQSDQKTNISALRHPFDSEVEMAATGVNLSPVQSSDLTPVMQKTTDIIYHSSSRLDKKDRNNSLICEINEVDIHTKREEEISLTVSLLKERNVEYSSSDNSINSMTRLKMQKDGLDIIVNNNRSTDFKQNNERIEARKACSKSNTKTETSIVVRTTNSFKATSRERCDKGQMKQLDELHNDELRQNGDDNSSDVSISLSKSRSTDFTSKHSRKRSDSHQEESKDITTNLLRRKSNIDNITTKRDNSTQTCNYIARDLDKNTDGNDIICMDSQTSTPLLKKKILRIITIMFTTMMFLAFHLFSHLVRLYSLIQSTSCPTCPMVELENQLHQLFLTIYYFNFVVNFATHNVHSARFLMKLLGLPRRIAGTLTRVCRQLYDKICHCGCQCPSLVFTPRRKRIARNLDYYENSHFVCISALHFSRAQALASDFQYVSPPCLLRVESSTNHEVDGGDCENDMGSSSGSDGDYEQNIDYTFNRSQQASHDSNTKVVIETYC